MAINLEELAARIEDYDRWRFVTTNGIEPTHAIARWKDGSWYAWEMRGDARGEIWVRNVVADSLEEVLERIGPLVEYQKLREVR